MKLIDRPEVIEFLGKAQSKIGELGVYIANRKHDSSSLLLIKELIHVVKAISCYGEWSYEQTMEIINYYNVKAELNNIPYVKIVGYEIRINRVIDGGGNKTTSVNDLVDYVSRTVELINKTPHNSLKEIQGGKPGEYYHLDKFMYDWLVSQVNPFVAPTVNLSVSSPLLLEKGSSTTGIALNGSYVLNSGKSVLSTSYYRGSTLLANYTGASINNNYTDSSSVSSNTTYRYEAVFEQGGTKSVSRSIEFELPYFSDIKPSGQSTISSNKVLSKKPTSMDIVFNIPIGNATSKGLKPYVMYNRAWGLPKNVYVDNNTTFDTASNWKTIVKQVDKVLADGTIGQYYLLEYDTYTEGQFTFNFRF